MVVPSGCFLLPWHREIAHTFHVSYDTCQVIDVLTLALRTFLQVMLADVSASVADSVRDVKCKVVTSLLGCNAQELAVLCF